MTITNYTTLVQAVQDVTEDDSTEFVAYIPVAIDLAEERLFKELDTFELETKLTGNLTNSNPLLSKPADYSFDSYFSITVGSDRILLKKRTEDFMLDYWPNSSNTGIPKYYCDSSLTQFTLAPTPNSAYGYTLKYTGQPTKLSNANLTNYYSDWAKDSLYFATMVEMSKFMKAWTQVQFWEAEYVKSRDSWNVEMMRKRRDNGETPMNPDSGPNSLKHTIQSAS